MGEKKEDKTKFVLWEKWSVDLPRECATSQEGLSVPEPQLTWHEY
jgi:hypothetical protein